MKQVIDAVNSYKYEVVEFTKKLINIPTINPPGLNQQLCPEARICVILSTGVFQALVIALKERSARMLIMNLYIVKVFLIRQRFSR